MNPVRHLWRVSPLQNPSISCYPPAVQPKLLSRRVGCFPKLPSATCI